MRAQFTTDKWLPTDHQPIALIAWQLRSKRDALDAAATVQKQLGPEAKVSLVVGVEKMYARNLYADLE